MLDWAQKVAGLVFGNLPEAWKLIPEHLRRNVQARLDDLNPFDHIPANEDLLRALRLAWVRAALDVDQRALALGRLPEWQAQAQEAARFSGVLRQRLAAIRAEAFRRDVAPTPSPIDAHLQLVLEEVPQYMRHRQDDMAGALGHSLGATLARLLHWPPEEVPAVYLHAARQGEPSGPGRGFGELVLAAFAEIVKHPADHPEAASAFQAAQAAIAKEVTLRLLTLAQGLDTKFDGLLEQWRGLPYGSIERFAHQADAIAASLARIEAKADAAVTRDELQALLKTLLLPDTNAQAAASAPAVAGWLSVAQSAESAELRRRVERSLDRPSVPDPTLAPTLALYAAALGDLRLRVSGDESPQRYGRDAKSRLLDFIQCGEIDAADALMRQELSRQELRLAQAAHDAAEVLADRARIARLREDMPAVCTLLREAQRRIAPDRALTWSYTLQMYFLLCREWRALSQLEMDEIAALEPALWMPLGRADRPAAVPDADWRVRDELTSAIDECANRVVANDRRYTEFRSWSSDIDNIANRLLQLAGRSGERMEALAAWAGLVLYGQSFNTSDDPYDIALNFERQRAAAALVRRADGR